VFFVDDNFVGRPVRARELLRKIIEWQRSHNHAFAYGTQVAITIALDDELLSLMREAGFWKVCIGFESTDHNVLRRFQKVQNTLIAYDVACRNINNAGILVMATLMIGFDGESPGVDIRLIDFAMHNKIAEVQVFPLRASPGTALWKRLQTEGRLFETTGTNLGNQGVLMNFSPLRPLREVLDELFQIYDRLFEPGEFLERAVDQICRLGNRAASAPSLRLSRQERLAAGKALWLQAVVYKSRSTFWRLLIHMLKRNQLGMFLRYSVIGACYFEFSKTVVAMLKGR